MNKALGTSVVTAFVSFCIAAALMFAFAIPAQAQTTEADLQAQVNALLAQIATSQGLQGGSQSQNTADLQAQVNALLAQLAAQQGGSTSAPQLVPPVEGGGGGGGTIGDVDTQPVSNCLALQNNLRYRSTDAQTGGEVSLLQDFLEGEGYLNSEPTGFVGRLTFAAVKAFQYDSDILNSGFVGPITRAAIKEVSCRGGTSNAYIKVDVDNGSYLNVTYGNMPVSTIVLVNVSGAQYTTEIVISGTGGIGTNQSDKPSGNYYLIARSPDARDVARSDVFEMITNDQNTGFTASPTSGTAPLNVVFTGRGSEVNYSYIDFGDGTSGSNWQLWMDGGGAYFISHTYKSPGTYTAKLLPAVTTMTTCFGCPPPPPLGSVTITVTGTNTGGSPTASPTSGNAPLTVNLSANTASGCNGGYFTLDYGDGTKDFLALPADSCRDVVAKSHTYNASGTYTAMLLNDICQGAQGCMAPVQILGTAKINVTGGDSGISSARLWTNKADFQIGESVVFQAKVVESDGNPLTPEEGATVWINQTSAEGSINDNDIMRFNQNTG